MAEMLASSDVFEIHTHRPADTRLVIIQASPFCNIDCSYCYLPNRSSKAVISFDTLSAIYRFLFDGPRFYRDRASFVWHAGEPLAINPLFYRKAFALQRDIADQSGVSSLTISNAFQTNGTLISDEWCELFKEWNIRIGVSLDGPQHIHDAHRKNRRSEGTFQRTMRGIDLLRKHSVDFNIISVVTKESIGEVESLISFYADNGLNRLAFNFEEIEGENKESSLSAVEVFGTGFDHFGRSLIDHWYKNKGDIEIRELDHLSSYILYSDGYVQSTENTPMAILNFSFNGDVSTFSPELLGLNHSSYGSFTFGNVHHNRLTDIFNDRQFRKVHNDIVSGIEKCVRTCDFSQFVAAAHPLTSSSRTGRLIQLRH